MMDIFNALGGMENAQQQISQQTGADPQQTASALEAAVPLLLSAATRNAQTPEGAAALDNALNDHSADTLSLFGQGQMPDTSVGEGVLGHLFGNQQSSAVQAVAQRAGISPQTAMQILAMVAPLIMSYLASQRGGQSGGLGGGIGSVLGSILGGNMGGSMGGGLGGGLGSVLGSVLGSSMGGNAGGSLGGGLGNILGEVLGGGQQQTQQAQGYQQSQGSVLGGSSVIPGYPADNSGVPQSQTQGADLGGLVGTLNNVLDSNHNGNALDDLIGMFGGRRS